MLPRSTRLARLVVRPTLPTHSPVGGSRLLLPQSRLGTAGRVKLPNRSYAPHTGSPLPPAGTSASDNPPPERDVHLNTANKAPTPHRATPPPRMAWSQIAISGVLSFAGISAVALPHYFAIPIFASTEWCLLIASFGSSAALVFGAPEAPFAQPRNVMGGSILSALVGVATQQLVPWGVWLTAPLSVSAAIVCMQATRTMHPPAAGTAMLAVIGTQMHEMGVMYAFAPVLSGSTIVVLVGVLGNRLFGRPYPRYWW